ncbi:MAG: hypothetical protein ACREHV_00955 [Rhizomicrobium sp.]
MTAHPIPADALDDRLGFIGTAGSGKTYNAGSAVERLLARKARVVIIDPLGVWWGLRLQADGKSPSPYNVPIFGGPRGDLPLTEHVGKLLGETAATMAESCIIDLRELGSHRSERHFMVDFLEVIYRKAPGEPFHLIVDEADLFAPQKPQKGDETLLGHMENIVRRGRVKGFVPWLISQRPAVLNKNVLSQVDGLIAFKLTASQDRDALDAWIEGQADKAQGREIKDTLPTMSVGQGVVWLPGHGILKTVQFPQKLTFDSSRTPKRGERAQKAKALEPVNLGALKERLSTVEADAKANDPTALRTEIARLRAEKTTLERQVATAAAAKPAIDPDAIAEAEKRGFAQAEKKLKGAAARELHKHKVRFLGAIGERIGPLMALLSDELKAVKADKPDLAIAFTPPPAPQSRPAFTPPKSSVFPKPPPPLKRSAENGVRASAAGELGKGERIVLRAIAQYPDGASREQLTVLTGYKRSSRDTYIQRLATAGFVEGAGNVVRATEAGAAALGPDFEPLPTGAALQAYWLNRLTGGEQRILAHLISVYPQTITRDDLDEPTGYKRSARDTYIQRLSARRLVNADRGQVCAADILFEAA